MADQKKISALPLASEVRDNDVFVGNQDGTTTRFAASSLKDYIGSGIVRTLTTYPGGDIAADINQAALAVQSAGGGWIIVPPKTYRLESRISLPGNCVLFCRGAVLLRAHSGDVLRNDLGVTGATGGYAGNSNISVVGGTWDGNPAEFYKTFSFFQIGHCENIKFTGGSYLNAIRSHVFDVSAVDGMLIEDFKMLGFATAPGAGESGNASAFVEAVQIDPNIPSSFPFGARNGVACKNIMVNRGVIGPNPAQTDPRFASWGCGVGQHGSVNNQFMERITIQHVEFQGCTYSAIRSMRWVNSRILYNSFPGCVRGFHVTPLPYNSSNSNNVDGTAPGYGQSGKGYLLEGNDFLGTTDIAIVFAEVSALNTGESPFFSEDVTLLGNKIKGSTGSLAMALRWVKGLSIDGAQIRDSVGGVNLDHVQDAIVIGVQADNISAGFISVTESTGAISAGISRNISLVCNEGRNIALDGINISCPVEGFKIGGNSLRGIGLLTDTVYNGISVSGGAKNGHIDANMVIDGGGLNKPAFGLFIASTCSGISVGPNRLYGKTGGLSDASTAPAASQSKNVMVVGGQIGSRSTEALVLGRWAADEVTFTPVLNLATSGNITPGSGASGNFGTAAAPWLGFFSQIRMASLGNYANDAAAAAGGVAVTQFYRNGSVLMIRAA